MNKNTKAHSVLFGSIAIMLLVPTFGAWNALPSNNGISIPDAPTTIASVNIPSIETPHTVTLLTYIQLDEVTIVGDRRVSHRVTKGSDHGNLEWTCAYRAEGIQRIDDSGNIVRIDPIKVCQWR